VLKSEEWDEEPDFPERVFEFDDERSLLEDFNNWMGRREIDILSGWNSSQNNIGDGFDYPYLLNRCENLNVYSTDKWSPEGKAFCGEYGEAKVTGVELIDLMQAYKKTQVHDLESYSLDFVANKELGVGKEEIEGLDEGYFYEPEKFVDYNIRDVEALVEINEESGVISLYESLREVTGAKFEDCHNNIDMIDVFFLRKAREREMALPTSVKPEENWYHGAFVYKPKPGKHKNILYPDLASLYPYLMKTLNVSPDSIIGTKEDLERSKYTEEQCLVGYIDPRPVKEVDSQENIDRYKDGEYKAVYNPDPKVDKAYWSDDPQYKKIYYVKPEEKEGFVTEILDELIDLKYEYSGKTYEAVKRVTNCFTEDTEVITCDGIKNIKDIEKGDRVYSLNNETKELEEKEVTETWEYEDDNYETISMSTNKIDFEVTPNHRMAIDNGDDIEYIEAGKMNSYTNYELPHNWSSSGKNMERIDITEFINEDIEILSPDKSENCRRIRNKRFGSGYVVQEHNTYEDMVHIKKGNKWVPRYYNIRNFLSIIAWYITEGYIQENYISISQINEKYRKEIKNLFKESDISYSTDDRHISFTSDLFSNFLEDKCGCGSNKKQIPNFIFTLDEELKEYFFQELLKGDGNSRKTRYTTKSEYLLNDFVRLCVETGRNPHYKEEDGYYRIRFKKSKNTIRMHRSSEKSNANSVYCVTVEDNNNLIAGRNGKFQFCGQSQYGVMGDSSSYNKGFRLFDARLAETVTLAGRKVLQFTGEKYIESMKNQGYEDSKLVYGDSDSVLTSIPSAETTTEALIAGKKASEYTKEQYDIFMKDEFNADEHLMDVEIESYASAIFFSRKSNDLDNAEEAAKKRYAQIIEWDEDEGFFGYKANPKPKLKGFDAIRSDTSQITKEVQEEVLRIILEVDEPKDEVYEYLEEKIDEIKSGEHLEKLGIPESINEELSYYGDDNRRCVPKIRGAKYATQNFEGVNIEKGGAPKTYRINSISQDYPQVYEAETPEDGDKVDAVSVENVSDLPVEDIEFDYDTMLDKTLKSSLEPILRTMGWSWNDVVTDGRQQGLEAFA
jgi:DNA polymerase I